MQSLRDKLLKAGLVTEQQAKAVDVPRPSRGPPGGSQRNAAPSGPPRGRDRDRRREAPPERIATGHVPKLPPLPGSKAHQRLEARRQLELDRQLLETVQAGEVPVEPGAEIFYFITRKGRLRRLELTVAQRERLEGGELAVVERREPAQIEHALVPAEVALRLNALSDKAVRFLNRPESPIGFMDEGEVKRRQDHEASGEATDEERADDAETAAAAAEAPGSGEAGAGDASASKEEAGALAPEAEVRTS